MRVSHLDTGRIAVSASSWTHHFDGRDMTLICLACADFPPAVWEVPWDGKNFDPVIPSATAGAIIGHFRRNHDGPDPYARTLFINKETLLRQLATGELTDIVLARARAAHILVMEGKLSANQVRRGLGLTDIDEGVRPLTAHDVERIVDERMKAWDEGLISALKARS